MKGRKRLLDRDMLVKKYKQHAPSSMDLHIVNPKTHKPIKWDFHGMRNVFHNMFCYYKSY